MLSGEFLDFVLIEPRKHCNIKKSVTLIVLACLDAQRTKYMKFWRDTSHYMKIGVVFNSSRSIVLVLLLKVLVQVQGLSFFWQNPCSWVGLPICIRISCPETQSLDVVGTSRKGPETQSSNVVGTSRKGCSRALVSWASKFI